MDNVIADNIYKVGDYVLDYKKIISLCTTGIGGHTTWDYNGLLVIDSYTGHLYYVCKTTQTNVHVRYRIIYSDTEIY